MNTVNVGQVRDNSGSLDVKSNSMKTPIGRRKRQGGFAGFGILEYAVIGAGIVAFLVTLILPSIKNFNDNQTANDIMFAITTVSQAAYDSPYGIANDYTGSTASDLSSFLPEGFSWRRKNGQTLTYAPNSNPTKFDLSIQIPNQRVLDRVEAKYDASQYSVSGTTITVTGP